ncbi:MAG: ComEA family DNA-binding protein [Candidatus Gottesmanbacteria bacterium]|nr:ComEA family DNA-binding protein [Candidatus Gottesmanbacteria bacterium]
MDAAAILRNYKIPILLGGISVLAIVVSIVLLVKSTQTADPILFSSVEEASGPASPAGGSATLTIDVEGAVELPGVYTLPAGSRVEDAITAAGGLGSDVDEEVFAKTVNRAAKITDGAKLYIPKAGVDQTSNNISDSQNGLPVSVNFATAAQLDVLPGVGPVTAQKIIDNRPYQTLDDLVTKKAIGPSVYEKLKSNLSL